MAASTPDLGTLLPLANENRWTDLLAALINTDPSPLNELLGIDETIEAVREVTHRGATGIDRPDLLIFPRGAARDCPLAVFEAKVLSGLGCKQLVRYADAYPAASTYGLVHLRSLPLPTTGPWQPLEWETLLEAYAVSRHPWAAATAQAWLALIDRDLPHVDADSLERRP